MHKRPQRCSVELTRRGPHLESGSAHQGERAHDALKILPNDALVTRVAQEMVRVESGHHSSATDVLPVAAELLERRVRFEEELSCGLAESDDNFRLNDRDLLLKKRLACLHLIKARSAVSRGSTFYNVAEIDLLSRERHRGDHTRQQLPRLSDEGFPLAILIDAWSFSNKHQACADGSNSRDDRAAAVAQVAVVAVVPFEIEGLKLLTRIARGI